MCETTGEEINFTLIKGTNLLIEGNVVTICGEGEKGQYELVFIGKTNADAQELVREWAKKRIWTPPS